MQLENMHSSFESSENNEFYQQNFVKIQYFVDNMLPITRHWEEACHGAQTHMLITDTLL